MLQATGFDAHLSTQLQTAKKPADLLPEDLLDSLACLYEEFIPKAKQDYRWELDTLPFDLLKSLILSGELSIVWLTDLTHNQPVAFLLYRLEAHRSIEINLIYIPQSQQYRQKIILDRLMRPFLEQIQALPNWDVISYAMLGRQAELIRTMTWYGFKPVGQAIMRFDLMDMISFQILQQYPQEALPEGYQIRSWQHTDANGVAQSVFEAFKDRADAAWDPRFRTLEGARHVVSLIISGQMGPFEPACTSVLLKHREPVGFCFLIQTTLPKGNIPLIGVRPTERGQHWGRRLLKHTLDACIKNILDAKLPLFEVNATMETDNYPAIQLYRHLGFQEEYNYPHVFLPRKLLEQTTVGRWCA